MIMYGWHLVGTWLRVEVGKKQLVLKVLRNGLPIGENRRGLCGKCLAYLEDLNSSCMKSQKLVEFNYCIRIPCSPLPPVWGPVLG